jgi:hypothetical protein
MSVQKIFFSYSRIDGSDFALKLAIDLKKQGYDVWIDQEDIRAGTEWDLEVEKALETCDCLLYIETAKSVESNNVLDEVYYALEQKKKVIPLIVHDSKTPFRLQRIQHIDFEKNYEDGLSQLLSELRTKKNGTAFTTGEAGANSISGKSFYKKYAKLIAAAIGVLIIIAASILYFVSNKKIPGEKKVATEMAVDSNKINVEIPAADTKEEITNKPSTKKASERNAIASSPSKKANTPVNLIEAFEGNWHLADVAPKAKSHNGYLKIQALGNGKVSIRSYMQFYYFKTNGTSFLTVFNGFAGCASCMLKDNMKLEVEDISIGSQAYKILKENEQGGGKAGDTVMNAGSNKSIRASVTLHLTHEKTAVIRVQQTRATALNYGLVLQPFEYSFTFSKAE